MDGKTVSVVMCTNNGAKYIREQLDSIISQTYPLHQASHLLLSPKLSDFFRLCLLCFKHRTLVYMNPAKSKGLTGMVRSLCYPLIYAYNTKDFREE